MATRALATYISVYFCQELVCLIIISRNLLFIFSTNKSKFLKQLYKMSLWTLPSQHEVSIVARSFYYTKVKSKHESAYIRNFQACDISQFWHITEDKNTIKTLWVFIVVNFIFYSSYPVPAFKQTVNRLKPRSKAVEDKYYLSVYERVVQVYQIKIKVETVFT